jgi:pyruvate/2-oxoglutarate dehydrogenase complex dihydrolipoamide acyltransferase (E2) component
VLCPLAAGGEKKAAAPAGPTPVGLVPMDGMMKAVAKNMEKTLDVPIFRVSRTITTDKFDELYKVRGAENIGEGELKYGSVLLVGRRRFHFE